MLLLTETERFSLVDEVSLFQICRSIHAAISHRLEMQAMNDDRSSGWLHLDGWSLVWLQILLLMRRGFLAGARLKEGRS